MSRENPTSEEMRAEIQMLFSSAEKSLKLILEGKKEIQDAESLIQKAKQGLKNKENNLRMDGESLFNLDKIKGGISPDQKEIESQSSHELSLALYAYEAKFTDQMQAVEDLIRNNFDRTSSKYVNLEPEQVQLILRAIEEKIKDLGKAAQETLKEMRRSEKALGESQARLEKLKTKQRKSEVEHAAKVDVMNELEQKVIPAPDEETNPLFKYMHTINARVDLYKLTFEKTQPDEDLRLRQFDLYAADEKKTRLDGWSMSQYGTPAAQKILSRDFGDGFDMAGLLLVRPTAAATEGEGFVNCVLGGQLKARIDHRGMLYRGDELLDHESSGNDLTSGEDE